MDFLIGTALGIIGAMLCVYFIKQLASPLLGLLKIGGEKTKVIKTSKKVDKIDKLIANEKFDSAINEIKKSFLLDTPKALKSVSEIRNHNQSLLSHCLILAEKKQTSAKNIAQVEHLLLERTELFSLHLKAKESFSSLKIKRKKEGKKTPEWSKADFENKIDQIKDELEKNKAAVDRELKILFKFLSQESKEEIVYH